MARFRFAAAIFLIWLFGIGAIAQLFGEGLLNTVMTVSKFNVALALIFYLCAISTGISILALCLSRTGNDINVIKVGKAWIFGSFIDNVVPTVTPAGEAAMSFFLNRFYRASYKDTLAAIGLYVSSWGISATFFAIFGLILGNLLLEVPLGYSILSLIIILILGTLTSVWLLLLKRRSRMKKLVLRFFDLYKNIYVKIRRKPFNVTKKDIEEEFEISYKTMMRSVDNKRFLAVSSFLFIIPQLCHALALWSLLAGFGLEVDFIGVLFVHLISMLMGLIFLIPSGLGVYELGSGGLLVGMFGLNEGLVIAAIFLYRLIFVWITNFTGGIIGLATGVEEKAIEKAEENYTEQATKKL